MTSRPALRPGPLPGVSLAWIDLDDPPEPLLTLGEWLSPLERERAGRFHFEIDRRRFVSARGALRGLLAAQLDLSPTDVPIESDSLGKPRLAARLGSDLRFNLSHTAGRALYSFAVGRELGVDAEALRPLSDMDALAHDVFSAAELAEWLAVPLDRRVEAFFNGWTRKEAFVKALGRGLDFPLKAFDVSLAPDRPARLLRCDPEGGAVSRWSISAWSPESGYVAALVIERAPALRGSSPAGAAGE
jgi:4'-phosphopantetheinyl transferase